MYLLRPQEDETVLAAVDPYGGRVIDFAFLRLDCRSQRPPDADGQSLPERYAV